MKVAYSVYKAITDWEQSQHEAPMINAEASMLHACNAVDGTAGKLYPNLGSNARFTRLLRENYAILGPMSAPGIDLDKTRFPVTVKSPKSPGGKPDIADIIYGIHRCNQAHGDELPGGFELIPDAAGPPRLTRMSVEEGMVRLSDRVIFGLLAVAVLSPVNKDQAISELDGFDLAFGDSAKLVINEWWGRASDFPEIVAQDPTPLVELEFGEWTT